MEAWHRLHWGLRLYLWAVTAFALLLSMFAIDGVASGTEAVAVAAALVIGAILINWAVVAVVAAEFAVVALIAAALGLRRGPRREEAPMFPSETEPEQVPRIASRPDSAPGELP
jgi:hypothetical protein